MIRPGRYCLVIGLAVTVLAISASFCQAAHPTATPVVGTPTTTPVVVNLSANNPDGKGCKDSDWTVGHIATETSTVSVTGTASVTAGFNLMVALIASCSATLSASTTLTASQQVVWSSTQVFHIAPCRTINYTWTGSVKANSGTVQYGRLLWHKISTGSIAAYSASGTGTSTTTVNTGCPPCG